MSIDIQDFCNSHGLITSYTVEKGVRRTAEKQSKRYHSDFDPTTLYYDVGNFTAVNTSKVIALINTFKDIPPHVATTTKPYPI